MPRTRRTNKVAIAEDEAAIASQVALPTSPVKSRAPLVEIQNREVAPVTYVLTVTEVEPGQETDDLEKTHEIIIEGKKNKKKKSKKKAKACTTTDPDVEKIDEDKEPQTQSSSIKTMKAPDEVVNQKNAADALGADKRDDHIKIDQQNQETNAPEVDKNEDSFVEQIISRSPAKHVPRIEDSVEALDKLEDALDVLDEVAQAQKLVSKKTGGQSSKQATGTKKSSKRPPSLLPPKPPAKSTKPVTVSTFELPGEAVARRLKEQREAREAKRQSLAPQNTAKEKKPAPPTKATVSTPTIRSTKPPTKPTFQLPGEAISRKLKEQREAREAKRLSTVGIPGFSKEKRVGQSSTAAAIAAAPRVKSTKPPTRPTFELPGEAISRKKREQQEARRRQAEEEEERRRQEAKAKPLKLMAEEQERIRKEREAAAKKAREEAAERGRQASREWAEKHRKKVVGGGGSH